jgi:hypothetical protein
MVQVEHNKDFTLHYKNLFSKTISLHNPFTITSFYFYYGDSDSEFVVFKFIRLQVSINYVYEYLLRRNQNSLEHSITRCLIVVHLEQLERCIMKEKKFGKQCFWEITLSVKPHLI